MNGLSHVDRSGRARMVDVSEKQDTLRTARAAATLRCAAQTVQAVVHGTAPKGSVISTAEIAGVMAAKRTAELIPLCHPLPLTHVSVSIEADEAVPGFRVVAEARARGPTGVEMEALTAASVACLTLFDMLKAIDRGMVIGELRMIAKSGGTSGDWAAQE